MSAFTALGWIILACVAIAFVWCMFERGTCQPRDFYKKPFWRKVDK
jgi:hypothetical protein